ncbi:L-2-hydroxyglutarate oxidase, partial [Streptomyces sp. NRRL F-5755]|uniref:L-2-hydroxyglutarate oxidase n=1 Tax=Streptomyces sp. NRRL F-5755 TaxID=1519475 RepID=UPI000AD198F8
AGRAPADTGRVAGEAGRTPADTERMPGEAGRTPIDTERVAGEAGRTPADTERMPGEAGRTPIDAERALADAPHTPADTSRTSSDRVSSAPAPASSDTVFRARVLINCAGLHCDRIARLAGDAPGMRIVPFRGEYHTLAPARASLVRGLVYPVPDPAFPFLGVHLTRGIDGSVHIGPNAVPALAREGYDWRTVRPADLAGTLAYPGSWHIARRHWRYGAGELHRSLSRRAFTEAVRRLLPAVREEDLRPSPAGVRAQAVLPDGTLADDFLITETPSIVHVLNAPSPAATASLPIGREIAGRALGMLEATFG